MTSRGLEMICTYKQAQFLWISGNSRRAYLQIFAKLFVKVDHADFTDNVDNTHNADNAKNVDTADKSCGFWMAESWKVEKAVSILAIRLLVFGKTVPYQWRSSES